jgi:hypothetical protein
MAATKRSSKDSRSLKETLDDLSKQVLFKPYYKPLNSGGQIRDYMLEEKGDDLLRLATEDEIVPSEDKFYMQDPMRSNTFYRTSFDPSVEWDSIMEFISAKKLYVRDDKAANKTSIDSNTAQSTLF